MTELKTLFHRQDPQTSKDAAERMVKSGTLSRQEDTVLRAINDYLYPDEMMEIFCDGENRKDFTAKQIAGWTHLKIDYYVIQRRLSGLHNKGKIERTGEKRDKCMVWRLI